MSNYKDTLNLPKTDFSMKADLAKREPNMLKHWEAMDLYGQIDAQSKGRPSFILHDGPPYANGAIHMGTTLNKVLKDMVCKSKRLSGFAAPYVPGWDCHGLPIELNVEKKTGKPGDKISVAEFRQACREFARSQISKQMDDFQRLGVLGDWKSPYLTMDFTYEANAVRTLAKIIANGHLMRGEKPVHWCTACGSALAETEVEYKDKTSPSIDVAFDAVNSADIYRVFDVARDEAISVPIWTTTPWTLPANQAVCLNPEFDYALVHYQQNSHSRVIVIAAALVSSVMQRYGVDHYEVLAERKGAELEGIELQHPFLSRKVPIILGVHVTTEGGTGNVHTAPAHGQDDYWVGLKYHLPIDNPVDSRSCFKEDVPFVAGMHVTKANEPLLVQLADSGHLLHKAQLQHSYPHCWRHKTPLIFRATPQWFISMTQNGLRDRSMECIDQTQWLPSWGKARITAMMENRPDWCISRQRTWGIPIAIFVDRNTSELHPETPRLMEEAALRIERGSIDAWFDLDPKELLGNDDEKYDKVTDILDVWFDSGVSHACVLAVRDNLHAPADLYLEGSDQHRGWFQTSLLTSVAVRGEAPFKTVLTHGFVVDGQGRKMSKSIGNTIEPADVVKTLGADILRLWAASSDYSGEIAYSDEIVTRVSDTYRRIRNTARFLLSNLSDFNPKKDAIKPEQMLSLDRWIVEEARRLQERIVNAYDCYQFQSIYQMIHHFCSVELGSFYLDIIKDRQYTCKSDGLPRRSSQTAMFIILEALVRWCAPVISFTAEEIWQVMPGEREKSVFLAKWYDAFPPALSNDQYEYWLWMMQVRDEVNKVLEARRASGEIGSALDAHVHLYGDADIHQKLSPLKDELRFVLITSDAQSHDSNQRDPAAQRCEIKNLFIKVDVSSAEKCERCWQRRDDVGSETQHLELCSRCVENVYGEGESRSFA